MNDLLLVLIGSCFGGCLTLLWALDRIEAYREDCENHRHAALALSAKLAAERKANEDLTEQVNSLLSNMDVPDPADFWKSRKVPEIEA